MSEINLSCRGFVGLLSCTSSIREYCRYILKFAPNPNRMKAARRSLLSIENVIDTL